MKRLRGSDAYAIYSESPTSPFVTLKVAIYRPTREGDVPGAEEIERFVRSRIAAIGIGRARRRIVRVPYDLHHPVWVADPDFSLDRHVRYATLPAPGGKAELCDFLSALMSEPLPPERPPWEIHVLRGLEHGRMAIAFKVHHALADGKTIAALIERSHSGNLEADARAPRAEDAGEPVPARAQLIGDALVDLVKSYTRDLPRFYHHLKQARQRGATAGANADAELVRPFTAPYTLLNESRGERGRVYRYETFSLAAFKALARVFDCTVNTLVIGVCSEAIRRYLAEQHALPEESLVTAMPIGDRAGANPQTLFDSDIQNNNLAVAILPLYQNIPDFGQRVQAIRRASRAAIDHVIGQNGRRFDNYLDFLPGTFIRLVNAAMSRRQANRQRLYANVVISNVTGPREPLHALDGRLEMQELMSVGNLTDGGNLNITVWSYVDDLCFSFYFRKDVLPAPDRLCAHLRDVVAELRRR